MLFPENISTVGGRIDRLFYLILWITGGMFFLVQALLLFFVIRYRRREGTKAHYTHGNAKAEVVWTVIPALILLGLGFSSERLWFKLKGPLPENAFEVEVLAEQFAWNIRYAGADGIFATPDDVTTINQMHIPVGKPVILTLRSKDVIHSFFVPELRVKQDAVPGMTIRIWFEATKTGPFEIECAELCGLGHYRMRGFLTVESPEDLAQWLEQTKAEESS